MQFIEQLRTWLDPYFTTNRPVVALAVALAALLIGFIVHWLLSRIVKRIARRTDEVFWDALSAHARQSTRLFVMLVFLLAVKPTMGINAETLAIVNHIITLLGVFIFAWVLIDGVTVARVTLLSNYDVSKKDNLRARKMHTQFKLLANILKFLIVVLGIGIGLMTFESIRRIGVSLLASAGIAGIILGFAAQKMIATVLAGLQLAITQPIRLDDVVIVENEWGWIEEITLTYVVVRIWDKRRLVVPTTYFIDHPFQNWTRVSADILGTVFIYADYTLPVDKVRDELTRILEASEHWDGQVNVLQVTDSKERTMEIRALMSAVDSPTAWNLRVEVREKLIGFLQQNYPECLPKTRLEMEQRNEENPKPNT